MTMYDSISKLFEIIYENADMILGIFYDDSISKDEVKVIVLATF